MAFDTRTHLFANNATARLGQAITVDSTTVTLETGKGSLFPNPDPDSDEIFILTVENVLSAAREIMYCTARDGDILSVERAQESTSAGEFAVDPNVIAQNRVTAGTLEYLASVPISDGGGGDDMVPFLDPFQIAFGDPSETDPYTSNPAFTFDPDNSKLKISSSREVFLNAFTFDDSADLLSPTEQVSFDGDTTYELMLLTANIVAIASPNGDCASFIIKAAFKRDGPGEVIEQVGMSVIDTFNSGAGSTWLVDLLPDFSSNCVRFQVTGSTGREVSWQGRVSFTLSGVTVS